MVVQGGGLRQVTLVIPKGTKEDIIDASFLKLNLWPKFQKIKLVENIRAREDSLFSEYLLRIGDDLEKTCYNSYVKLPSTMIMPYIKKKIH